MPCNGFLQGFFGFDVFSLKKIDPNETVMYYITMEFAVLIAVTHLIHFVLKHLGQSIVISAILAGIVTGETGLRRAKVMQGPLRQANDDVLSNFAGTTGASFMLLIGIYLDLKQAWNSRRRALLIAAATSVLPITFFFISIKMVALKDSFFYMLFFSHTSSPITVRIITELKLVTTDIGQLAIVSALANDLACMVLVMFSYNIPRIIDKKIQEGQLASSLCIVVIILTVLRPSIQWLNRRNRHRRYIRNYQLFFILVLLIWLVFMTENVGLNGALVFFLIGILFPREGPTIRTLKDKLRYLVHNFILPVYFGWISSRIDLANLYTREHITKVTFFLMGGIIFSVVGKVGGTVAAATYLKIPFQESIPLGFILNVKGNVDILSNKELGWAIGKTHISTLFLVSIIVNTLVAGASGTIMARRMKKKFKRDMVHGLKKVELEEELRVLACVHKPIEIPGILTLAKLSINGTSDNPYNVMLQHLIGLPENYNKHNLFYNQRPYKDELNDEDSLGHEYKDVPQINACVDDFTRDTGISVRQIILASFCDTMHKFICQDIYNLHRTLVLIPSHKEQRYDGKMVCREEERRRLNLKILKEAPCTVGIFMDRPLTGGFFHGRKETETNIECFSPNSNIMTPNFYHVVAIFCGGPDDQEAVEYAGRLAMHPFTDVTVVRFLPSKPRDAAYVYTQDHISMTYSSFSREIAMIIHKDADERNLDDEFLINFQQRFVAPGKVKYIEKYAKSGVEIEAEMKMMVGMYSLFIIGRGRQPTAMMVGLSDWQECIEIGPIGDMLSSDAFMNCGSVLIIQSPNNRSTNKEESLMAGIFQ